MHLQHVSPAGFNQRVSDHSLLNTTKAFVFLTLVDITSYEPTEYMESEEQSRRKPTDLAKPKFFLFLQESYQNARYGGDLIGLSNFYMCNLGLFW